LREKLLRYVTNETTPEERKQVEKLLEENEEARNYIKSLQEIWMNAREKKVDWDVEKAWENFSRIIGLQQTTPLNHMPPVRRTLDERKRLYGNRTSRASAGFKFAAVFIFMILSPLFFMWKSGFFTGINEEEIIQREIITKKGQFTRITLSDGTRVFLNAESVLNFPERFTGENREVRLEGEGYFEVILDPHRRFRILAAGAVIEVLGTSFNVNTRTNQTKIVSVVVSEGVVALRGEGEFDERGVTINEGMMSSWTKDREASAPVKVDLQNMLAWMRGELIFESTPLKDVIIQLERRYNIVINVEDESLLSRRLTASYSVETIDDIIKNVALTINVSYRKENDNFYFLK
jgi:transmembrane sensor